MSKVSYSSGYSIAEVKRDRHGFVRSVVRVLRAGLTFDEAHRAAEFGSRCVASKSTVVAVMAPGWNG